MKKSNYRHIIVLSFVILFLAAALPAQNWLPIKRLTWNNGNSWFPRAAMDAANILHVVWSDDNPGNEEIFHKRSTDNGLSWSNPTRLTWDPKCSAVPRAAADSKGHIYVVWTNLESPYDPGDLYLKKSTDGGITWSLTHRLTWGGLYTYPAVAIDDNDNIHLIISGRYEDIYYKKSTDGGTTWSPRKKLTWGLDVCRVPDISLFADNFIHLTWYAGISKKDIYYKRSADSGVSWSLTKRLTWNPEGSNLPKIAADGNNNVFITWTHSLSLSSEIYYIKSTDGGVTWRNPRRLTWSDSDSEDSTIGIDSNNTVHIIWNNQYKFFHRWSENGGSTWSLRENIPGAYGYDDTSNMMIDGSDFIHLVWQEGPEGGNEIYYSRRSNIYPTSGSSSSPKSQGQ